MSDAIKPPPLRNDCFALPAGVHWTPVEDALAMLRDRLTPITSAETIVIGQAMGRVLAADVLAPRANPPLPNTAVDGFGFAGGRLEGVHTMQLLEERAAAGPMLEREVPVGHAVRILTGAALPSGVDTVVLQEDVTAHAGQIAFNGPIKSGANTRRAGEDVQAGDIILKAGRRVTAADMALMAATGVHYVSVRMPLRVAVISTGDELIEAGLTADQDQIYDANRPMLLSMMDTAASTADVILTSGGASAGDEDHVSALLTDAGSMQLWRIAIKPGRPLALAMWNNTPVFGLPGNPVAVMVCTLIFARPAMAQLAGAGWAEPVGYDVPAGFSKSKKAGRREYLRARMNNGRVEVFGSEGSGRISGLSWADGLVELPEGALMINEGDLVRYIPFGSFDI